MVSWRFRSACREILLALGLVLVGCVLLAGGIALVCITFISSANGDSLYLGLVVIFAGFGCFYFAFSCLRDTCKSCCCDRPHSHYSVEKKLIHKEEELPSTCGSDTNETATPSGPYAPPSYQDFVTSCAYDQAPTDKEIQRTQDDNVSYIGTDNESNPGAIAPV